MFLTFSFHHSNKGRTNLSCCHEPAVRGCAEWLIICSGLFGCLPLWASRTKQLPQQQKLIAMITEALPSGAVPRENSTHTPTPLSQYAKETLSRPKYIQWYNREAAESHRNMKLLFLNIHAHPIRCTVYLTRSGSGINSEISSNGVKTHRRVCIGFVWRRLGTYVSPCVQGSALLNSKAWECVLLFTTRLRGLFDMRKGSVWQKPSYPLCPCFCLGRLVISFSLRAL